MDAEAQNYLDSFVNLHAEMGKIVRDLPAEALNRTLLPADTNSIAVLVAHMCGSETLWVHQALSGRDVGRDRDAEFRTRASSPAELTALIDRTEAQTRRLLESLPDATLGEVVDLGGGRPQMSKRACLMHAIEHGSLHLGHLELTRQLAPAR